MTRTTLSIIILTVGVVALLQPECINAQSYYSRYMPAARSFLITGEGGVAVLGCDLTRLQDNYYMEPTGGVEIGYLATNAFSFALYYSRGNMEAKRKADKSNNTFNAIGLTGHYFFRLRSGRFSPFLFARLGGLFTRTEATIAGIYGSQPANGMVFGGGAGIAFYPARSFEMRVQVGAMLTTTDLLDATRSGLMNDGYSTFTFGLTYYIRRR